jgi:hypothetical protein
MFRRLLAHCQSRITETSAKIEFLELNLMPHGAASGLPACLGEQTFPSSAEMRGSWDNEIRASATSE